MRDPRRLVPGKHLRRRPRGEQQVGWPGDYGGHNWYCLSDTAGAATTPGADATVWGDMGAGSSFSAWSGAGTYYIGLPYYASNANGRSTFYNCYSEGGRARACSKLPSQVFGGIHAAGNPSGYGLDPTVSTAPFWDADLAGAIRVAHIWFRRRG